MSWFSDFERGLYHGKGLLYQPEFVSTSGHHPRKSQPSGYPNWFNRKIEEPSILMGLPAVFEIKYNYAVVKGSGGD
jgi:hypothetical protein